MQNSDSLTCHLHYDILTKNRRLLVKKKKQRVYKLRNSRSFSQWPFMDVVILARNDDYDGFEQRTDESCHDFGSTKNENLTCVCGRRLYTSNGEKHF